MKGQQCELHILGAEVETGDKAETFVFWHGWVEDPASHIDNWDIAILPSRWEGYPRTVVECFAKSVPLFAYRIPSMEWMLGTELSEKLLAPIENLEELARAMADTLADPDALASLRTAVYERYQTHFAEVNEAEAILVHLENR